MKFALVIGVLCAPLAALHSQTPPRIDYHQHLFSPAVAALITGDSTSKGISANQLLALLDSAGIRRALILSMGYTWGSANRDVENEYEKVKAENDWTSRQVSQHADRLRAFCSFNPLKPYAMDELARCAKDPQLRRGLKLHFGNSDIDLDSPQKVEQVREVFKAANDLHMPIVVHLRTSISRKRNYGAPQARTFLNEILPAARDVPVQIAHLAGAGDYGDAHTDSALSVFADAIARKDARMKNVWFDVTTVVVKDAGTEKLQLVARRLRQLGMNRILYGSDAAGGGNLMPREAWAAFRKLPLTEKEFDTIATNVAPYMKW